MNPRIEAMLKAKTAERTRDGLTVETTRDGRASRQSFATPAARDEYMARARRLGATVSIVEA